MLQRTVVHLLRHGEVENPRSVLYGRLPDYHLSERGQRMAQLVADHLAGHDVAAVIASPLERAQETAAPVAARHGVPIGTDERIIEAANAFEGRTFGRGSGSPANPSNWPLFVNPFRPSWGEPYREIASRMRAAITEARDQARGREIVLVSHQLPVWTARRSFEGGRLWHDPRSRECTLASLTSVVYAGDQVERLVYSEPAASLLPGANPVPGA